MRHWALLLALFGAAAHFAAAAGAAPVDAECCQKRSPCWLAHPAPCSPLSSPAPRSVTRFLSERGFYETWDFFDSFTWYPLGRVVGGTMYPGARSRRLGLEAVDEGGLGAGGTVGCSRLLARPRIADPIAPCAPWPPPSLAGLIFTAGFLWNLLQALHIPIHVQEVGAGGLRGWVAGLPSARPLLVLL